MIGDFLDIILAIVSILGLICFFILCSNVSAIKKHLTEDKVNQDKKIDELRKEIERTNMTLGSIDRKLTKQS